MQLRRSLRHSISADRRHVRELEQLQSKESSRPDSKAEGGCIARCQAVCVRVFRRKVIAVANVEDEVAKHQGVSKDQVLLDVGVGAYARQVVKLHELHTLKDLLVPLEHILRVWFCLAVRGQLIH